MPNPYTGTDNDPFQEAQHVYAGKDWERYFASLQGKNVDMRGFGQPGRGGGLAAVPGGPTAASDANDLARTYAVDAYGDSQKAQAQKILEEGNALFLKKDYAQALEKYKAAVAKWDHPAIRFNMVRCLIQLDKPVEASAPST